MNEKIYGEKGYVNARVKYARRQNHQNKNLFKISNMRVLKMISPECGDKSFISKNNRKYYKLADFIEILLDVKIFHPLAINVFEIGLFH
ncbi:MULTISPECIES: hypothetical protein [Xenorhabdus]|uniref:hypothetical protein n=1 Tax=Xenorhabdus TaxID=626 RepID=UPI00128C90C8|nr:MULTISPECIES: hypothetical protein [Xenorhabdus]